MPFRSWARALRFVAAWWVSLRPRRPAIGQFVEIVVIAFMLATVAWLLRFGKDDWGSSQDHLKDWSYYSTLRQAVETRQLPLYSRQGFLQTERYFANAETPLGPHAILLAFMDIRTFFLLHALLMAGIGAAGLLAVRRELRLALFGWTVFVIAFVLNAFTTWHLAEGNTPWVSMWLLPWIFWTTLRLRLGDTSNRTAAVTSLCLALMIVNGAWHIFMWSAMIIGAGAIGRRQNLAFLTKTLSMLLALTAFRTVPAFLTVGGGQNEFGAGFAGVGDLVGALLTESSVTRWSWFANTNFFVSWFGFALIASALVPWPRSSSCCRRSAYSSRDLVRPVHRQRLRADTLPSAGLRLGTVYIQVRRACGVGDAARRLLPCPGMGHVAKSSIMADDLAASARGDVIGCATRAGRYGTPPALRRTPATTRR